MNENEKSKEHLEGFLKHMKEASDEKLNDTFVGALNLSADQKNVVTFVFWFCYMAETDLESCILEAWKFASSHFSPEVNVLTQKIIIDTIKGYREQDADIEVLLNTLDMKSNEGQKISEFIKKNYSQKRVFTGLDNLPYFIDKIRVYEYFFGKTDRTKLLYEIMNIRNALSHNRTENLEYKGNSLYLRSTKEEIIKDYFETQAQTDFSKSKIWNQLTPEEIAEVESLTEGFPKITSLESFRKK